MCLGTLYTMLDANGCISFRINRYDKTPEDFTTQQAPFEAC